MTQSRKLSPELDLVRRIQKRTLAAGQSPDLVAGIGDDCAIYRPRPGEDLLFTTDMLIEDVHFRRDTHSAAEVGHKALARGLSDIAAMGGEAGSACFRWRWRPGWTIAGWTDSMPACCAWRAATRRYSRAGTCRTRPSSPATSWYAAPCRGGKALRRDGARPGDRIYVSGRLGKPWQTHRKPIPRLDAGLAIRGVASAAMDLSDGLSIDLHRLCEASGVAADLSRVPVVRGSTIEQALHGGEDYELLFTVPPEKSVPGGMLEIGVVTGGAPGVVRLNGLAVPPLGYDHFRR